MEPEYLEPKYEIDVKLIGSDSNVYNLIGIVRRALVAHGSVSLARIKLWTSESAQQLR